MEENRKRSMYAGEFAGKRQRTSEDTESSGNDDGDILPWLSIDDETVADLSKLLETEINLPVKVKFIDNPYSSPEIFQSSSSFITINGNEESCGSSYSDSDSSVMVSIDLSGVSREAVAGCYTGGAWASDAKGARGWTNADEEVYWNKGTDGHDCYDDYDDEMLAKFIGEEFFET